MKLWHWIGLAIATIASIIVEFTMHHDVHHSWSGIPLFWIIFGFIGCILIITFAKSIGTLILLKKEDYYNDK
jgi:hypothetical protein